MSEQELKSNISDYISKGKLLQLATKSRSELWMCHVWFATGENFGELYFTSNLNRRHSKEIEQDPNISGGIISIELEGLGQKVRGISFSGIAKQMVSKQETQNAYQYYAKKWPQINDMFTAEDILSEVTDMRMYQVKMKRIVLFDEVLYPDNPRQELRI